MGGFHSTEREQRSRNITTFITYKGLHRCKHLMLGISSAPELYLHTIQQELAGSVVAFEGMGKTFDIRQTAGQEFVI